MKITGRLNDLDARLGAVPKRGESWLVFLSRKRPRRPVHAALVEAHERLVDLEQRVAELEAER